MLACRSLRAVPARLGLVASLSLAAGGALAQDHYDVAGTRIPAFVLLDGCPSEGACAGPNGLGNPLFVAPATGASWAVTGAFWPYTLNGDGGVPSHVTNWPSTQPVSMAFGQAVDGWNATEGAKADSAYVGAGAASVVALLKGLYGELAAPLTTNPALASSVGDGVVTGGVITATINSGGAGYVSGDVGKTVNLVGGTSTTPAQLTIASVSGGAVTGVSVATSGIYTSTSGTGATTGGGTAGSGLTLYLGFAPIAQTLFSGTAPVDGWKIVDPNASGDMWVSDNGTTPTANGASSYRCAASGGSCKTEPGERPPGSALQLLGAAIGAPFIARRW